MTRRLPDSPADIADVVHGRYPDPRLTSAGRRTAHRQLADQGVHPSEIARLLGVTPRTVYRWQATPLADDLVSNLPDPSL